MPSFDDLNFSHFNSTSFKPSPWDEAIFQVPCYEIIDPSETSLAQASSHVGHYTVKLDPLADKALLHRYGFYYADTLIEPSCKQDRLINHSHVDIAVVSDMPLHELLNMCDNSFVYGRFHRDFNLSKVQADQRYKQWLEQLYNNANVFGLLYKNNIAGFIACSEGKLMLHAMDVQFRGQGLAKFMWSAVIKILFEQGENEIRSSISASNLAALNLYSSLGFHFDQAQDIYHRLTEATSS
ncbi:MAG: GNAT family N-acetyltransferase [Mariprofundus sp.]|nr:GNAT family N-acetyltransferase [Mariprofundus sp.]